MTTSQANRYQHQLRAVLMLPKHWHCQPFAVHEQVATYQKLSALQTPNMIYVITNLCAVCQHEESCVMFAVEEEAG